MLQDTVRQFLATHYMLVDDEWLSGCVEYLTEDGSNNYTENDIKNLAKEQWLLNDLKDICPGSLPANLGSIKKTMLNGRFVLQINTAIDIGTPAYQQYLKLQKVNTENVDATTRYEDKIPNHRMIKLYLTDGVQEVTGIEYRPMRNLSCDITPGCKVLIKGSVECRRGMLLLTEGAVELLGGEVQEIAVSNSLPELLSCKLSLPVTMEPDHNTTLSHPRNTNIPTPHTQMPPAIEPADQQPPVFEILDQRPPTFDLTLDRRPPTNTTQQRLPVNPTIDQRLPTFDPTLDHRPVARVTSLQVASFNDEDIDIDQLAAIEAQIEIPSKRSIDATPLQPEKKFKLDTIDLTNKSDDYPNPDDLFVDEDDDYLRELETKMDLVDKFDNRQVSLDPEPFVYIKQITDMAESERVGRVFKVKGQIMKLLSKLSVGKEGWSLKCTIVDGTGSLDVEFTSDVLSKLVGYTPQEMNQLKKQMATKPEIKEKAVAALQKAKETLQVLYCIIELTMLEVAKITRLTPFDATHVGALQARMLQSGL